MLAVTWHGALVPRRVADPAHGSLVGRPQVGIRFATSVSGWVWWVVVGAAVIAGALAPQSRSGPEFGEVASPLFVVGLSAVLATTGALMLVGPLARASSAAGIVTGHTPERDTWGKRGSDSGSSQVG